MISSIYLSIGKSALYFSESLPLILLSNLYIRGEHNQPPKPEDLKSLFKEIYQLHKLDHDNIQKSIYPSSVARLGSPIQHTVQLLKVMSDALVVARRMKTKEHKDFSGEAKEYLNNLPDYYSRNFHFQTDGYLSEFSAKIYDHQVEILFNGTAQTMRRLTLPPLRKEFDRNDSIEILDLACGPGSLTRDLALTFPKAKITALDLSFPYLKEAQKKLQSFSRVNFLQGNAEELPFKDQKFDAVTCSYLFHELPLINRKNVIKEIHRVVKPGGVVSIADSIQDGDAPQLDWALQRFPINYHEPFYKNYLNHPLENLVKDIIGFSPKVSRGFFTKCVSYQNATQN